MRTIIAGSKNKTIVDNDNILIVNHNKVKYPDFARRFRLCCKESNAPATQKEIAYWLGRSQATINDWLNGNKLPSMETAIILAYKFGCSLDWLMTGRGSRRISGENIYDVLDRAPLTAMQKSNFKALIDSFIQQNGGEKRRKGDK